MITAVDTNVLLDLVIGGSPHASSSERALFDAARAGGIVVSEPVVAEVASSFESALHTERFITRLGGRFVSSDVSVLHRAGEFWRAYTMRRAHGLECSKCGAQSQPECDECGVRLASRQHMIADFIIGAHAEAHADALLTRDRGYYRTYFPKLKLI